MIKIFTLFVLLNICFSGQHVNKYQQTSQNLIVQYGEKSITIALDSLEITTLGNKPYVSLVDILLATKFKDFSEEGFGTFSNLRDLMVGILQNNIQRVKSISSHGKLFNMDILN